MRHALQWDLSPLRPWEYWQADAQEWHEALSLVGAYRKGVESVEAEDRKKAERARQIEAGKREMEKQLDKRASELFG